MGCGSNGECVWCSTQRTLPLLSFHRTAKKEEKQKKRGLLGCALSPPPRLHQPKSKSKKCSERTKTLPNRPSGQGTHTPAFADVFLKKVAVVSQMIREHPLSLFSSQQNGGRRPGRSGDDAVHLTSCARNGIALWGCPTQPGAKKKQQTGRTVSSHLHWVLKMMMDRINVWCMGRNTPRGAWETPLC